jgi:type II secretion system protein L
MRTAVGLVLCADSIHAVELTSQGRRLRRNRDWSFSWATPQDCHRALEQIAGEVGAGAHWVVGIPGDRVTQRRVSLPMRGRESLLRSLAYALEEYVPDDSDALCVGWIGLEGGDLSEGLALALPAAELQQTLQMLAGAGIDPEQVVPADLASWLGYGDALDSAWVLDLHGSPAAMVAFRQGRPVGRHVFNSGGLGRSELRWAWLALERQAGATPSKLYVAGDTDTLREMSADLPVAPERLPALPVGLDYSPAAALASAAFTPGMARHLTLRSGNLAYRGAWTRNRRAALAAAVLGAVCAVLWVVQLAAHYWQLSAAVDAVRAQTLAVFREVLPNSRPVNMPLQMEQYLSQLRGQEKGGQISTPRLLRAMLTALEGVPEGAGLVLDAMRFDSPRLVLEGSVASRSLFERWRQSLEASAIYQTVTAGSRQQVARGGRYGFALTLQLRPDRLT